MAQDTIEKRSAETVTVGCKLPNGLHCDINQPGEPHIRFTLKGTNSARVIGGFGITEGIPKAQWDRWYDLHKALDHVKRGFVFAMGQTASVESKAKESAAMKNGYEPKDPAAPAKDIAALTKD